jgi:hypothetical protein
MRPSVAVLYNGDHCLRYNWPSRKLSLGILKGFHTTQSNDISDEDKIRVLNEYIFAAQKDFGMSLPQVHIPIRVSINSHFIWPAIPILGFQYY